MTAFQGNRKLLGGAFFGVIVAALAVVGAVSAFGSDGDEPVDDGPVNGDAHPGQSTADYDGFHDAQLDLAGRLDVAPLEITLRDVRTAGFDGCIGVVTGDACPEVFVPAFILNFEAQRETYRYHIGNGQIIATDFVDGNVSDGTPIEDEQLKPDTNAYLAAYTRGDLALRLGSDAGDITIEVLHPYTFSDQCLDFVYDDGRACAQATADGAVVKLGHDGDTYRYHVSGHKVLPVSFEDGHTFDLDSDIAGLQRDMREDLADRLDVGTDAVSVVAHGLVTWPDGCLGVQEEGVACTQALVDGFRAELKVAGEDTAYAYHGAGIDFIPVAFLDPDAVEIELPVYGDAQ